MIFFNTNKVNLLLRLCDFIGVNVIMMIFIIIFLVGTCKADVAHELSPPYSADDYVIGYTTTTTTTTTTQGPPNPYSFGYKAGRFPGHVDRAQVEIGDGVGNVKGSYSFVDPKFKVRTVEYTVDENGFHPHLINYDDVLNYQPKDSEAVRRAKERHRVLYDKIAAARSHHVPAELPKDTVSVAKAKDRHYNLFQEIAAQHAAIAAERESQRLAFEATSVANEVH